MDMRLGNERGGAGALFTTAADLVLWNDALASGRLGKLVTQKIQEPATLSNGRKLTYARGLSLLTEGAGRMLLHGGGAAAYRSIAARFLDHGLSVAVLCNAGEASDDRDDFAGGIVDLILADRGFKRKPSTPPPAGITGVDVSGRAGLFFNERTGDPLRLIANNGRLAIAGGGPLVTVAADRFRVARPSTNFMSNDEFELRFLSQDQFELTSMEGQTTRYRRAQPWAPTAADLVAFAGRYESDELRAVLQIAPGKGGVSARLNESPTQVLELSPVDPDTFQRGMQTVHFHRDPAGKVVGLDLINPALRSVRFTRVSDGSGGR
jgi:hypothetical protein